MLDGELGRGAGHWLRLAAGSTTRNVVPAPTVLRTSISPPTPAFEVKETKDPFEFKADVPGVEAKDLDVKLTGQPPDRERQA